MRILWALSTATLCYAAAVRKCGGSACPVSKGTSQQQVFLKQHNYLRQKHQNTPCMTLDSKLNRDATSWAKKLLRKNKMEHATGTGQGENLYMAGMGKDVDDAKVEQHVKAAVDMWYAEIKDYNYKTASAKRSGVAVGHFTQVVWAASTNLGLGYAYGKKKGSYVIYVVGRYSPPGNFHYKGKKKEYYSKNVQRVGCSSPGGEASVAKEEKKKPESKKAEKSKKKNKSRTKKKRRSKNKRRNKSKSRNKNKLRFKKKKRGKRSVTDMTVERKKKKPCKFAEALRKTVARKAKKAKKQRKKNKAKKNKRRNKKKGSKKNKRGKRSVTAMTVEKKKKPCKFAEALRKTVARKAKKAKKQRKKNKAKKNKRRKKKKRGKRSVTDM